MSLRLNRMQKWWWFSLSQSMRNFVEDWLIPSLVVGTVLTAAYIIFVVYEEKQVVKAKVVAPIAVVPLDVWKTNPLPDGTFETFRKVQYVNTVIQCYSVIEPKKNKTLFHTCTFTAANNHHTQDNP